MGCNASQKQGVVTVLRKQDYKETTGKAYVLYKIISAVINEHQSMTENRLRLCMDINHSYLGRPSKQILNVSETKCSSEHGIRISAFRNMSVAYVSTSYVLMECCFTLLVILSSSLGEVAYCGEVF
jgi:hypothetical protein